MINDYEVRVCVQLFYLTQSLIIKRKSSVMNQGFIVVVRNDDNYLQFGDVEGETLKEWSGAIQIIFNKCHDALPINSLSKTVCFSLNRECLSFPLIFNSYGVSPSLYNLTCNYGPDSPRINLLRIEPGPLGTRQ
jgi:hypothetical protein